MGSEEYRDRFEPVMSFVRSAQHKGNLYECNLCGQRVWSGFGNADRHLSSHNRSEMTGAENAENDR